MRNQKGWKKIISSDVKAVRFHHGKKQKSSHTMRPGQWVQVDVHRRFDAPLHSSGLPGFPQVSTRSVLARLGVEVGVTQSQVPDFFSTQKTPGRLVLTHMGKVPVTLRKGNRLGRFYFHSLTTPVSKSELHARLQKGDLRLDSFGKKIRLLKSGVLEIKPERVVFETPAEALAALKKERWASGSKRGQLMKLLSEEIKHPRTRLGTIILTQTPFVRLPKDLAMIFHPSTDGTSFHIRSLLIDPGFEGPIVLELFGLKPGKKPDSILASLVKAP